MKKKRIKQKEDKKTDRKHGTGKYPGHFKKSITLRTNAKTEMVRLYIEGDMTAKDAK